MENSPIIHKNLVWTKNGRLFGFGTSPEADWKIIIVSIVVLVILVIILSVFIFIKIDKGEIFAIEQPIEQGEKALDANLLRETVTYYQNKKLEFESIRDLTASSSDPSLY